MKKRTFTFILSAAVLTAAMGLGGCAQKPQQSATSFRANDLETVKNLVRDFDHYTVRRRFGDQTSITEYHVTPECISYLDADRVQTYVVYNNGDPYQLTETDDGYNREPFSGEYSSVVAGYGYIAVEAANWEYRPEEELYRSEMIEDASIRIKGTIVTVQLSGYAIEFYNFGVTTVEIPRG